MRPEHVTRTLTNGSAVYLTYTFWYNFDTVSCEFLETETSVRCLYRS